MNRKAQTLLAGTALALLASSVLAAPVHEVIIRQGMVYDGSGKAPYRGDVAIDGDRISYIGRHAPGRGKTEVDARGQAIAPGFINMLAHPEESLLQDGRALSDITQGVTLEVMGEMSMGPVSPKMRQLMLQRQYGVKYPIEWTTLGEYLETLVQHGIAPNVASFVGAGTVRSYVLDEVDVQPDAAQLSTMRGLVHQAMEEGALGVTAALIYSPDGYAKTPELVALASESARCGGMYIAHMRSEGDRIEEAVAETIEIAQQSGGPAEIYHLKFAGQTNWSKIDRVLHTIEATRAAGTRITADMYTYTAGATGLDAAMPPWVQDGGLEQWIEHLKDPATRARVLAEMRNPQPEWENLALRAGPAGMLLLGFKNPALLPYLGKTLAAVAAERGVSAEDAAIDLVIEDGTRVGVAYFLMSEDNLRRQIALPWVSFGSDAAAPAPEGVFLAANEHPRAYGNFTRVLAKYVRDESVITLQEAVRKLTALPAANLALKERGQLRLGYFADVVVFNPATVQDHATFENSHQLSTGVSEVWVNGVQVLAKGVATGAAAGRVVRGRAWKGWPDGGCRATAKDWPWNP